MGVGLSPVSELKVFKLINSKLITVIGTIIGVFATKNGNEEEKAPAYFSRWRYTPVAQAVEEGKYVHVGY